MKEGKPSGEEEGEVDQRWTAAKVDETGPTNLRAAGGSGDTAGDARTIAHRKAEKLTKISKSWH